MKLLPSWREKRYYMLVKFENQLCKEKELIQHINNFLGYINAAKAGVMLVKVKLNEKKSKVKNKSKTTQKQPANLVVLSINRKFVNQARAALTMLNSIHCIYVSGSLKKIKEKIRESYAIK